MNRSTSKKIPLIIVCSVLVLMILYVVFQSFFGFYEVYGNSMSPALQEHEIYLVQKNVNSLERGDIVVFYHPDEQITFIKRVIGLPNDIVEIKQNRVFVNEQAVNEPYVKKNQKIKDYKPVRVPAGNIFVLGDDVAQSYDSRDFGMVRMDWIEGKIKQVGSDDGEH
ncbi:signal peptidase I [Lihuaxuella thermophila]|uniref:Signal peptidase I n=1 Tax=Lihuaxuella thermophila TaxID=1173111 RepID=A0A1H8DBZ6_9BACL|nr:signal peptidase I [Lihuaxuella thermophila]SEN04792.1 signal peptidase I [Lihuaxuella thermophila]